MLQRSGSPKASRPRCCKDAASLSAAAFARLTGISISAVAWRHRLKVMQVPIAHAMLDARQPMSCPFKPLGLRPGEVSLTENIVHIAMQVGRPAPLLSSSRLAWPESLQCTSIATGSVGTCPIS